MKLALSVEQSLKNCPPSKNPALKNIPEELRSGCRFIERRLINTNNVTYRIEDQTRILKVKQDGVAPIKGSFYVNGFIHTEYPPVVVVDPDNENRYFGMIGHTRDQAFKEMNVQVMIYDVYEFSSPLAKRYFNNCSNQVSTPRSPHTKEDIVFQTLEAINNSEIGNGDDEVKKFIDGIAGDKTDVEKKKIFSDIRKRKSKYSNIATYHCGKGLNSTVEFAKKNLIPYSGDDAYAETGKLGYIPSYPDPIKNFMQSKTLLDKHGFQDIYYTLFVPKPAPQPALNKQRAAGEKKFNDLVRSEAVFIQTIMEKLGYQVDVESIADVLPWKILGWLPQDLSPDVTKGGNPKETTVVDKNGNPVET